MFTENTYHLINCTPFQMCLPLHCLFMTGTAPQQLAALKDASLVMILHHQEWPQVWALCPRPKGWHLARAILWRLALRAPRLFWLSHCKVQIPSTTLFINSVSHWCQNAQCCWILECCSLKHLCLLIIGFCKTYSHCILLIVFQHLQVWIMIAQLHWSQFNHVNPLVP